MVSGFPEPRAPARPAGGEAAIERSIAAAMLIYMRVYMAPTLPLHTFLFSSPPQTDSIFYFTLNSNHSFVLSKLSANYNYLLPSASFSSFNFHHAERRQSNLLKAVLWTFIE